MGLFEWWFENKPHPIGSIDQRKKDNSNDPINWVILILGQIAFWVCFYFILELRKHGVASLQMERMYYLLGIFALYLIISYIFDVKPNYDNVGIWGGMIDHPFRYTDDYNRFLIFLKVVFYPGYLMAASWIELWKAFKQLL